MPNFEDEKKKLKDTTVKIDPAQQEATAKTETGIPFGEKVNRVFCAVPYNGWATSQEVADSLGLTVAQVSGAMSQLNTEGSLRIKPTIGEDGKESMHTYLWQRVNKNSRKRKPMKKIVKPPRDGYKPVVTAHTLDEIDTAIATLVNARNELIRLYDLESKVTALSDLIPKPSS